MRLVIQKDPKGILGRDIIDNFDGCAFDAVLHAGGNADTCRVFLNGKELDLPSTDFSHLGDEEELTKPLENEDLVMVIMEPKGGAIAYAIIAVVAAVAAIALAPSYDQNAETENQSTNNELYGQTNSARLYQAIPDAYGKQVMYPDLATSEAARRYSGNSVKLQQLMVLGLGVYEKEPIKLGSTLLSQIPDATATWYEPDTITGLTTIPEHEVQFTVAQVDGQELPGTEDQSVTFGRVGTTVELDTINDIGTITVSEPGGSPLFDQAVKAGDTVELFNCEIETPDHPNLPITGNLNGIYTVASATERSLSLLDASATDAAWASVTNETYFIRNDARATRAGREQTIGPFDTAVAAESCLVEFVFPRGISETVELRVDYEEIDEQGGSPVGGGVSGSTVFVYSGDTINAQYRTENVATAPAKTFWRVSVTRQNDASTDPSKPNIAEWQRLASYTIEINKTFPKVSMLLVEIPENVNAFSPRENQVNVEAERKTITYNTVTKVVDYTLSARGSRFADAVLHEHAISFGRDPSELDLDELYAIQEKLDTTDLRLGQFASTYDDIDMGLGERIENICDTCRVTTWNDGITWRFYRYEAKQPSGIITRRDLSSRRSYNRTYQPRMPSDSDSVKLEWVNPDDNKKSYVYRSYDAAGNILTTAGQNPVNVQLNGCRNLYQAENRADIEIRRILYEREFLTDTLLSQGMLYDLGDVVKYADVYRTDVFNGEILSISGLTAYTSEKFLPEIGKTYEVEYNDELGDTYGPFEIEPAAGNEKAFTLIEGDLLSAYVSGGNVQLGSRYIISEVGAAEPDYFWVTGKSPSDRDVELSMSQYDQRIFEVDP